MQLASKFSPPIFAPENKKLLFFGLPAALTLAVLGQIIAGIFLLQRPSNVSPSFLTTMKALLAAATALEILAIYIMRWYWQTYKSLAPGQQIRQEATIKFIDTVSSKKWVFLEITMVGQPSSSWKLKCYPPADRLALPSAAAASAPTAQETGALSTATVFLNKHQVPFIVVLDRQRYWVKKIARLDSISPDGAAEGAPPLRPNLVFGLHVFLFAFLIVVAFPFAFIAMLLRPCHPINCRRILQPLGKLAAKTWGLEVVLNDPQQAFETAPHIIVSNHQASLDLLVGACVAPWRAVSIGKRSLVWIPLVGPIYWLSGNILINRQNPRQALQMLSKLGQKLKAKQQSVWVMPEGTRNQGQGLLPFKKGPFKMAVESKIDVLPVAISSYQSLNFNKWHAGTITVNVLPIISTEQLKGTTEDINQVRQAAHDAIKNAGLN